MAHNFALSSRNGHQKYSRIESIEVEFKAHIARQKNDLKIPSPGRKTSGLYPMVSVFKYFPRPETLEIFLDATKSLASGKAKEKRNSGAIKEVIRPTEGGFNGCVCTV